MLYHSEDGRIPPPVSYTHLDVYKRQPWGRLLVIALAGTVPFLSFWAEYSARKDVQARLRAVTATGARADAEPDGV